MKKGGFTLVEIMIVVAIIGLLAAIAIPNFMRARTTTVKNKCLNNLRLISAAKDQYHIENAVPDTTVLVAADVQGYLKGDTLPAQPYDAGTYTIGAINTNPSCNSGEAGHAL